MVSTYLLAVRVREAIALVPDPTGICGTRKDPSVFDILAGCDANAASRKAVATSLLTYAAAMQQGRLPYESAETLIRASRFDEAVEQSQFDLRIVEATVVEPLNDLIAYHSSGYTAADIANVIEFAKSIGIGFIAKGVN